MRAESHDTRWQGEDLRVEEVAGALDRAHHELQQDGRGQALVRTLNLIVAPTSAGGARAVEDALAQLGAHSPSRTLVLRRHGADRLDAEILIECERPDAAGRVGVYHDRLLLTADDGRLEHASSLLAPLLLRDLPTVLWLPEPDSPIPDPGLLERAQQVLVDSADGDAAGLRRFADLARSCRVHDLAWGRLEFWRAATAAAFEPPERRALLPQLARLDVRYEDEAFTAGLLLAGWIVARAGWNPGPVERNNGKALGVATRADGGQVALSLNHDPRGGCGGIETVTLSAGSDEVKIGRGAATSRLRDLFAEALQPTPSFARGYPEAIQAALAMSAGGSPGRGSG
jgi:glucose-6-phosphate dehydrogenase assembly protein OpcA